MTKVAFSFVDIILFFGIHIIGVSIIIGAMYGASGIELVAEII